MPIGGTVSNIQCKDARLWHYSGPFFPDAIADLNVALDARSHNAIDFVEAADTVEGYLGYERPKTSDGYSWFWALVFAVDGGLTLIAIPWAQDWERADGSRCDRSAAVYTRVADNYLDPSWQKVKAFTQALLERDAAIAADDADSTV
jgi:hypothetical protein